MCVIKTFVLFESFVIECIFCVAPLGEIFLLNVRSNFHGDVIGIYGLCQFRGGRC